MKKTLKVFALTALAFTMIFTSCNKDVKPNIDVVQVEASKITVEAYPCENRISWTPVSNADYALYRNGSKLDIDANSFIYIDTKIFDGVEYEYKIITTPKADFEIKNEFGDQVTALGGSNKTAYYTKGNSASAKVTAIVPATTAITAVDLIDFDKKAKKTSKVTADNFVFDMKEDYFYYSFPTVDYLSYNIYCYRGNEKDVILFENSIKDIKDPKYNGKSIAIPEPGDYTLVLKVTKAGYADTVIESNNQITVKALDVATATGTPNAVYIDDGKTARILWTPAKKADGSVWAPANYNVYSVDRNNNYTSILGENVKVGILDAIEYYDFVFDDYYLSTDTVYYVDYVLPEGESNLIKNFCVVLSSEDGIEKGKKTCKLESANIEIDESTGSPTAKYIDEKTACIYWKSATKFDGNKWPAVNYNVYTIDESGFWKKMVFPEGVSIKSEIIDGQEYYCVNVEIANTDVGYNFGVQLADGNKKEKGLCCYLDALLLDVTTATGEPQVAYINENTARVWWTPAVKKDKKDWPAKNYTVYTIDENGFWTPIKDAKIESTINGGKDVYYFEVKIADTTKEYEFGVELADGDKKETRLSCTLDAKALDIADRTGEPSAEYISEDTVRIWWTPATKKSDESEWATTNYAVYVKDENAFFNGTVNVSNDTQNGKVVYYVDYEVEDNEEKYTFEVILSINGEYVDIKEKEVDAYKSIGTTKFDGSASASPAMLDKDDLFANDAVLTISLAKDEEIEFVKYKVLNESDDFIFPEEALLDSAFVELPVAENYYDFMDTVDNPKDDTTLVSKFIVKNLKEDEKVVFLYSIVEEDKEPYYSTATTDVVSATYIDETTGQPIVKPITPSISIAHTFIQTDFKSNVIASFDLFTTSLKDYENWTVQIFYAKLANDDNSVTWNEIVVPAFKENADKNAYVAKTEEVVLKIDTEVDFDAFDGEFEHYNDTYAFKYVYTCKGVSEPIETTYTMSWIKDRE